MTIMPPIKIMKTTVEFCACHCSFKINDPGDLCKIFVNFSYKEERGGSTYKMYKYTDEKEN